MVAQRVEPRVAGARKVLATTVERARKAHAAAAMCLPLPLDGMLMYLDELKMKSSKPSQAGKSLLHAPSLRYVT